MQQSRTHQSIDLGGMSDAESLHRQFRTERMKIKEWEVHTRMEMDAKAAQLQKSAESLNHQSSQLSEMHKENDHLRRLQHQKSQDIARLNNTIEEQAHQSQVVQQGIIHLQRRLDAQEMGMEKASNQHDWIQKEVGSLINRFESLRLCYQQENEKCQRKLEEQEMAVSTALDAQKSLQETISGLNQELDKQNNAFGDQTEVHSNEKRKLEQELQDLKGSIGHLEQSVADFKSQVEEMKDESEELRRQLADKEDMIDKRDRDIDSFQALHKREMAQKKSEYDQLDLERNEQKHALKQSLAEQDELKAKLSKMKEELKTSEDQNRAQQEVSAAFEVLVVELKAQGKSCQDQVELLTGQLKEKSDIIDKKDKEMEYVKSCNKRDQSLKQEEMDKARATLDQREFEFQHLKSKMEQMEKAAKEVGATAVEIAELKAQGKVREEEIKAMKTKIKEQSAMMDKKDQEIDLVKTCHISDISVQQGDIDKLQCKVDQRDVEIQQLKMQLDEVEESAKRSQSKKQDAFDKAQELLDKRGQELKEMKSRTMLGGAEQETAKEKQGRNKRNLVDTADTLWDDFFSKPKQVKTYERKTPRKFFKHTRGAPKP